MRELTSLRFVEILFACAVLFMGAMACAMLQERPGTGAPAASLVITPISGLAASVITIRGSGFIPGEKIEVLTVVDGIPVELGEEPMIKEANEAGAFKAKSGIPLNAKPGIYSIKAIGDKGTVAVAPLEVEEKKK
ncbi:MAG: hypothetical protein QME78_08105 [Thermodesulfobacteriota bacterium]|nr:hypothetical protein [Thermodesulfobacteriota bacterium]